MVHPSEMLGAPRPPHHRSKHLAPGRPPSCRAHLFMATLACGALPDTGGEHRLGRYPEVVRDDLEKDLLLFWKRGCRFDRVGQSNLAVVGL